jgi:hypothetical protein
MSRCISVCLALTLLAVHAISQPTMQWDGDCAISNEGCGAWSAPQVVKVTLQAPDCIADVEFRTRICSTAAGVVEDIVVIGWTSPAGCGGFDYKSYFHQRLDGIKEYVILGLLSQWTTASNTPACPDVAKRANVYSAACGTWVCCEYTVDPTTAVCETGWVGPPPHYGSAPTKVKSCKWQACGTACCRRIYSICLRTVEGFEIRDIKMLSRERLGPCSGQAQYAKPCEDGC